MKVRSVLVLVFIVYTSSITISTAARYHQNDADDDDVNHYFKRLLFNKDTSSSTRSPSIIDNLVFPTSTRSTPSYWPYKSTNSPYYPSSACTPNPCEHSGICTSKGQTTYDCKCVDPWRGIHCNIADACYRSPCQNGGTCYNVQDDYWCKCTNDYYGTNCQTRYSSTNDGGNNCRANICNTGRCVSLTTTYYCQCPDDRYGEHCEKRLNYYKRDITKRQTFLEFLDKLRRGVYNRNSYGEQDDGRAYYDFKNGMYF